MIRVRRLSGEQYYLNPLLIETIEATPDTIITLITGKKLLVKESAQEVVACIKQFYQSVPFGSLPPRIISQSLSEGVFE